jgi:lysophospholipase L1-like esterase
MLGTNDSKVIGDTWTDAANDEFMACAETLFATLKEKSPDARFAFMNCPVKFTTAGYGNAYMIPVQKAAAEMLADKGYDVTHYDMRAYTTAVLTSANFRDGLHPDYAGYMKIAEGALALVEHLLYGDDNAYIIPLN